MTSLVGGGDVTATNSADLIANCSSFLNETLVSGATESLCDPPETALVTKVVYAIWVWCIFFTFPGTYSMQPAVTTQTFGHK